LPATYDAWLVALSYFVASLAAYTAVDLAGRVNDFRSEPRKAAAGRWHKAEHACVDAVRRVGPGRRGTVPATTERRRPPGSRQRSRRDPNICVAHRA